MKLRAVIDLRLSLALKFITRRKRCLVRSRTFRVLFLLLLSPALLPVLQAQDNFEIQIYPSETVAAGENMLELHSNYTIEGQRAQVNGVLPSHHALHETIEYTHGFNLWFETGFYLFTSVQPGARFEWVGNHIRPRVRAPESWGLPVGLSLSTEVGYMRRAFSEDTWSWEIRPIFDKQIGRLYLAVNPSFEKSLHGANSARGWEFAPSGKASLKVTRWLDLGLEYYSTLGQVGNFERFGNQQHTLMPAIDLNVSPRWEINFGVGRASTTAPTPGWSNLLSAAAFNRWKFARMNGCTSSCSFR